MNNPTPSSLGASLRLTCGCSLVCRRSAIVWFFCNQHDNIEYQFDMLGQQLVISPVAVNGVSDAEETFLEEEA